MRVADYIVARILENGTNHVFMLSGGGAIYLDDALACNEKMKITGVKNEATAPMMAEAYARITGNVGAVFVTTGPGGTNAVTGVAEAWVDSAPVLVISGQVETRFTSKLFGKGKLRTYGTQELDIINVVTSITKYSALVETPDDIRYHLDKALYLAKDGRPGPVWLDIPLDIQSAEVDIGMLRRFSPHQTERSGKSTECFLGQFEKVCFGLQRAKRPLMVIGQGIRIGGAIETLQDFLEAHPMPVISSRLGQDILPYRHPCYCGHGGTQGSPATKKIIEASDFILAVGSRMAPSFTGGNSIFKDKKDIFVVDIDKPELEKHAIPVENRINCDAKTFLNMLFNRLAPWDTTEWMKKCQHTKQELALVYHTEMADPINLYDFIRRLDELSDSSCVFVSDAGSSYYSTGQCLTFNRAKREITSGAFASMGLALPLAIGAYFGDTSCTVLAVTGDGSIETNIQELHTLALEQCNVKLFVINNGGYLSIRNTQDAKFNGRYINSNQRDRNEVLEFTNVAKCFGLPYYKITKNEEIDIVYRKLIAFRGPALIEVFTNPKQKIYNCY